jgi:hypothetical protein
MRIAAGVMSILAGLGFGLPGVFGLRHFRATGEVWTFLGFPTYGGGPFESAGLKTSTGLLAAFVVVCLAEVVVGVLLIAGVGGASVLAYLLLPIEMVYWIGFALPFGPVLGIARTVLLLIR